MKFHRCTINIQSLPSSTNLAASLTLSPQLKARQEPELAKTKMNVEMNSARARLERIHKGKICEFFRGSIWEELSAAELAVVAVLQMNGGGDDMTAAV